MLRKSNQAPLMDRKITGQPSATSLFGGGKLKHTQCEGCRRGEEMSRTQPTKHFWTERTP